MKAGNFMVATLTRRESEVLIYLCEGLANKQIAAKLFVSPSTVHAYIRRIFTKTGTHNRVQAVVYAIRHDLVDIKELDDGQAPPPGGR